MLGHHVQGSILQVLTADLDAGRVLYRSWAATDKLSVRRNKDNCYWKSSSFAFRKLRDLYERGPGALDGDTVGSLYAPYSNRLFRSPRNGEMCRLLPRLAYRIARRAARKTLWYGQWGLGLKVGKSAGPAPSLHDFHLLVPPRDRSWADPFPVASDGRYFVFVKEVVRCARKGRIAVIEVDEKGSAKEPVTVLERDHPLSYPFVFEWRGAHYMVPESRARKTIELYRSVRFPFEWEPEKVLIGDIRAVDATLAEIEGRWWMFANVNEEGASPDDELHLFHADSPLGPWTPHRRNPVKSDVRCSRPAGRLFFHNGDLYRPAQDCSVAPGYAISINKVVRLDADGFLEQEVSKILPRWSPGIERNHTLNSAGRLTVVDCYRPRRRLL
jgi:hypothetical protein